MNKRAFCLNVFFGALALLAPFAAAQEMEPPVPPPAVQETPVEEQPDVSPATEAEREDPLASDPLAGIDEKRDDEPEPLLPPAPAEQKPRSRRGVTSGKFITYGGLLVGAGAAQVEYNDWMGDSEKSVSSKGYYVNPSVCMIILIPPFCGQTETGVSIGSQSESATSVTATRFSGKLKYLHDFSDSLSFGGGVGAYCEIPPATKKYDGAGFLLHTGGIYHFNSNLLLIADIEFSTGYFGMGHDSSKTSYGISAGVLTRLGNL